jgi:hypothetical protein
MGHKEININIDLRTIFRYLCSVALIVLGVGLSLNDADILSPTNFMSFLCFFFSWVWFNMARGTYDVPTKKD